MKRVGLFLLIGLSAAGTVFATRITDVTVDLIKGYQKSVNGDGDTVYSYMGRVTYHFFAEGNDSVVVDFTISPEGSQDTIPVFQKTGDIGPIRQNNAADTVKTAYFRADITGNPSASYIGTISGTAEMSRMWRLADSITPLIPLQQRQLMLYVSLDHPVYKFFGQDNCLLNDGTTIVGWRCADGPHGIRYPLGPQINEFTIYGAGDTVTLFPTEAALGCSWDRDLTFRIGQAIGRESRAMGVYCNLGPMADLVINPRWGRAFETMGEDPYHVGKMVSSQVMGLQSVKVIATPKHFTPYVMENIRPGLQVIIDERALRELFCVPFEMSIKEGGARAIMTCYHRLTVPGYTITEPRLIETGCDRAGSNRHLINDILRNDWGFDGIIMTDWDGAAGVDEQYAYETELDMSMPGGKGGYENIARNITSSLWTEEPLNRKIRRIMYGKLWAWNGQILSSEEQLKTFGEEVILSDTHKSLSLEAARKCIVLAKNDPVEGKPLLPLDRNATLKVAVVGPYAKALRPGGGGSSAVTFDMIVTPLQGIKDLVAGNPNITVTEDYNGADVAIVCVGVDKETESEDRPTMTLPNVPINQNNYVATVMSKVPKTVVVYTGGSASSAGNWSEAPAIVIAFYPGRSQGQAIAEVLFGAVNPGGHLNVTFPGSPADLPAYEPVNYALVYPSADSAHGYFLYEKKGMAPLFWFGHGLSYTTFSYDNIRTVTAPVMAAGDRIDVVVTLTNTGEIAGDDVVQLYIRPKGGTRPRRVKDLRGFARVSLAAKETKSVPFVLGPRDFSIYEPDPANKTGRWTVVPGEYDIVAGSTSDPAALTGVNGSSVVTTITIQ